MLYKIEIFNKPEIPDGAQENLKKDIYDLGIHSVADAKISLLYFIEGNLSDKQLTDVCYRLLADPITQDYTVSAQSSKKALTQEGKSIEVYYKADVTDAAGDTVKIALADLKIKNVESVRTGMKYSLTGPNRQDLVRISEKLLANKVVQNYKII